MAKPDLIFFIITFFVCFSFALGGKWKAEDIITKLQSNEMNLNPNYFLFDPEAYLNSTRLALATEELRKLYEKYERPIHIILVESIEYSFLTPDAYSSITLITRYISRHFKIDERSTISMIFGIEEQDQYIRTDSKKKDLLNDSIDSILKEVLPFLKEKDIDTMIFTLIKSLRYYMVLDAFILLIIFGSVILFLLAIFVIGGFIACCVVVYKERKKIQKIKTIANSLRLKKTTDVHECILCLESNSSQWKTLECFHLFHQKCIDDWMILHQNCPLCLDKFQINKEDIRNKDITKEEANNHNIEESVVFDNNEMLNNLLIQFHQRNQKLPLKKNNQPKEKPGNRE